MKTLGKKIAEYRKLRNMTQEDLAGKLNVSSQAVSKWENDLSIPDLPLLIELADIFGVSMDELVRQKEDTEIVRIIEEPLRKPITQMMLRIRVLSVDGDKVNVNLPMSLVQAAVDIGMNLPEVNGKEALKGVDFAQLISLVEHGAMGKLVEVESAEGDHVEIYVE